MTRPTRQEILQATRGQELDSWVAEHVMGWDSAGSSYGECHFKTSEDLSFYVPPDGASDFNDLSSFAPSRNWNEAMDVRDYVMSKPHLTGDFYYALETCVAKSIQICHSVRDVVLIKHLQPQHICQAALLAVCEVDETEGSKPDDN